MLHLKIISARHLHPSNGKSNHLYVKAFLVNFGVQATKSIGSTKKVKKVSEPSWHEVLPIPFVAAQGVHLEIYDETSHNNTELVGSAEIQFSEEILNGSEQKTKIQLEEKYLDEKHHNEPILKYSIEPCTRFPFKVKNYKNPDAFYCYLSANPPLKPNEKVELNFGSINNEGTVIQGIENYFVNFEKDPTHLGPTGLTQAFYFSRLNFVDAQFFFYAKIHQYKGVLTLNFVYSPIESSPRYLPKKFIQSDKNSSITIEDESPGHDGIYVFPLMVNIDSSSVSFNEIKIPDEVAQQGVPEEGSEHSDAKTKEAIDKIYDIIGKQICPETKEFRHRFNIYPGNRYTLDEAFKLQKIDTSPRSITICIGWDPNTHMDSSILPVDKNGKALEPICYFHPVNTRRGDSIRTTSQTLHNVVTEDNEKIRFKLTEIDKNVQYFGVAVTAGKGTPISKINGVYCRIIDEDSKREVMFLNPTKKEDQPGLLFGILTCIDGIWNFWPTETYFKGSNPDQAKSFFVDYVKSGVVDQFMKTT